jgi:hypothetical protein
VGQEGQSAFCHSSASWGSSLGGFMGTLCPGTMGTEEREGGRKAWRVEEKLGGWKKSFTLEKTAQDDGPRPTFEDHNHDDDISKKVPAHHKFHQRVSHSSDTLLS